MLHCEVLRNITFVLSPKKKVLLLLENGEACERFFTLYLQYKRLKGNTCFTYGLEENPAYSLLVMLIEV